MVQQLKTININVIPGQSFCRQCKAQFLLETEIHCIDDEGKVQSVMNSLNVKHQGKSSNLLVFHLSVYTLYFSTAE